MDFLARFFNHHERKSAPRSLYGFLTNNVAPDMKATERLEAYKGWVYACVNAISEEVAGIELKLQKRSGKEWTDVEDHIALGPLETVNPFMSSDELWMWTQGHLELDGNAFWYLPPGDIVKKPLEIWPLTPTRVTVVKSETKVVSGYVYRNERGQDVPLPANLVIHFKRFNPNNRYRGVGTVEAAALAIDIDTYSAQWNRNFFYNSAVPSAVLETEKELTDEQYVRLKAAWEAKYGGVDNAHKTAILEGGLKFAQAGLSQRDMQFLEQRTWSRDEILGIFRVPRTVLGITDDVNRANAEATDYVFAKRVVKPRMAFLASRLSEFYLPLFGLKQTEYRFTFADPVPQNTEIDLKVKQASLANLPWKKIDEVRAAEGLDPLPDGEGDKFYMPGTFKTADLVINPPEPAPMQPGAKPPAKSIMKGVTDRRVAFIEKEIAEAAPKFEAIYHDQAKQLVTKMESQKGIKTAGKKDIDETERSNELVRFLFSDWSDWIGVLLNPTRETLQTSFDEAGRRSLVELDVNQTFDQEHSRAIDWLEANALKHAKSIAETVKGEVSDLIVKAVQDGKGAEDIAADIRGYFTSGTEWKALRIARTEVISGYAQGSLEGYRQSGIVKYKQWLDAGDGNVDGGDPTGPCAVNAKQGPIPLEAAFASGADAPPNHPNCRCVLQPVTSE